MKYMLIFASTLFLGIALLPWGPNWHQLVDAILYAIVYGTGLLALVVK